MFHKTYRFISAVIIMLLQSLALFAQDDSAKSSIDKIMRSNDKIYVVMAVGVVILLGLFLYLIRIDRKVSKLENKN
ncbi:hypothetical protein BH20BAC1_BH20BAC1_12710 [soil metagenome]